MLLIVGYRVKRKKKGYAAIFCACCRKPMAVEVTRLSETSHVYYISFGYGKPKYYETKCPECGMLKAIELKGFRGFTDEPDIDRALAEKTTPDLAAVLDNMIGYEKYIQSSEATRDDRINEFRDTIDEFSYMADTKMESSKSESISAVVQLGMIVSGVGVAFAFAGYAGGVYAFMWYVLTVIFVALTAYRMAVTSKRTKFGYIRDLLAKSLRPLNPTLEELEEAVLQMPDHPLARVVKPRKVFEKIYHSADQYTKSI